MSQQASSSHRAAFESTEKEAEVRNDQSAEMRIVKITSRGEEKNIERYGGDDIHEPAPKEFLVGGPSPIESETNVDANMVTWDGPNDPSDPQNWSIKYKWWVTTVVTIMTLNVYV